MADVSGFLLITVRIAVSVEEGGEPGRETVTVQVFFGPSAAPAHRFWLITNPALDGVFAKFTTKALVEAPPVLVNVTFCDDFADVPATSSKGPGDPLWLDGGVAVSMAVGGGDDARAADRPSPNAAATTANPAPTATSRHPLRPPLTRRTIRAMPCPLRFRSE
jgi:hypothetical protein